MTKKLFHKFLLNSGRKDILFLFCVETKNINLVHQLYFVYFLSIFLKILDFFRGTLYRLNKQEIKYLSRMRLETLKYGSERRETFELTYLDRGEQAIRQGDLETSETWFDQAADYWNQAILLAPSNYIEAHNWLKMTGRF